MIMALEKLVRRIAIVDTGVIGASWAAAVRVEIEEFGNPVALGAGPGSHHCAPGETPP
jgi:hypothetical protein